MIFHILINILLSKLFSHPFFFVGIKYFFVIGFNFGHHIYFVQNHEDVVFIFGIGVVEKMKESNFIFFEREQKRHIGNVGTWFRGSYLQKYFHHINNTKPI